MERLRQSVKERIRRALEERTRAETRKPISQGTKDKVEIKEEISSRSTCPQSNQSSVSSVSQGKQNNRKERTKVFQFAVLSLFDNIL